MATEIVIRPRKGLRGLDISELWRYRELFGFLAWRDILIRYKQTFIGIAWAVLQPVLIMIVFTVIFGRVAKLGSNGAPYAVMTFAAVLPWQFFSNALSQSSNSLVMAANMIRKVYFPRLIIPVSVTLSGTIDFLISLVILLVLMVYYDVPFRIHLLLIPVFFFLAFCTALGAGLWLGALNVKYRDVKYIVPFFVRMGMYVSPVGFMSDVIPRKWIFWYSLNPMVGVIDGFRWAILGSKFEPYWPGFWASIAITSAILISGAVYFRTTEKHFADLI